MNNLYVGTDLVEINRLAQALESRGQRMARRLFTEQEWTYCQAQNRPAASLAARFAAKEALRKIFGQWGYGDVVWRETEVSLGPTGAPRVSLHGTARDRADEFEFALSLSHTEQYAQAFCVAWYRGSDV